MSFLDIGKPEVGDEIKLREYYSAKLPIWRELFTIQHDFGPDDMLVRADIKSVFINGKYSNKWTTYYDCSIVMNNRLEVRCWLHEYWVVGVKRSNALASR